MALFQIEKGGKAILTPWTRATMTLEFSLLQKGQRFILIIVSDPEGSTALID